MGVSLNIITSSDGAKVRAMVEEAPLNIIPLKSFYGDPSLRSYALIGAKTGAVYLVRSIFNVSRLVEFFREMFFVTVVGVILGTQKQKVYKMRFCNIYLSQFDFRCRTRRKEMVQIGNKVLLSR
jgi:hypothetical protein